MKTIKINNVDYYVKNTIRSIFIWEQIMARPFEIKNTMDNYVYFYSIILANNKDNCLEWNEFLDALDDNPNILVELTKILTESQKIEDLLNPDSEEGNGKKKD